MKEPTSTEWSVELEGAAVLAMEATLREGGFVAPLTAHLLCDELRPTPYAGFAHCRPFYRGDDAHDAIVALGLVASMVNASRLVIAWEQSDLQLALHLPGPPLLSGLVVVDVPRRGEHIVSWRPAEFVQTDARPDGLPVVTAEWGEVGRVCGGQVPPPISQLLELWRTPRTWSDTDLMNTYLDLEDEGYRMRWTQPPDNAPLETWPRWRRVVEAVLAAQDQA